MVQWKRLGQVLTKEAWPVWVLIGGFFVAWVISYLAACCLTDQIMYAGTLLQLSGLGTVAFGIADLRKSFRKPTVKERLLTWIEKVRRAMGKPVSVNATVGGMGFCVSGGFSHMVDTAASGSVSLEDRVEAIEGALRAFLKEHEEQVLEVRNNISRVEGLVNVEGTNREKGDADLLEKIEEIAVGGIRLEAIGLAWLVLGMLGTSIPKVLASCVPATLIM